MKETPFTTMLRAYGIDPIPLPDNVAVTHAPGGKGIYVETYCLDPLGRIQWDELTGNPTTRSILYPHPEP